MKTILMTLSTAAETKNLMQTAVRPTLLADPELRLVVLAPRDKAEFYKKEYGGERVIVETSADLEYEATPVRRFWRSLSYNSVPTRTVWTRSNKQFFIHPSLFEAAAIAWKKPVWLLGHTRLWREFVRWVEFNFFKEDEAALGFLFDKYRPDLVFATNVIHGTNIGLAKQARRRQVRFVGMVKTWDNLTSKGLLLVKPDALIVPNGVVAREAEALGDLPAAKIFIGGVPQYDDYADPALRMSREEFAAAVGLDPAKKILLYAMGGIMNQDDPTGHLAILDEAIEAGRLPPATVILRAHPKYDIGVLGISRFKNVLFYQPGKKVVGTKGEWEFDREDVRILLNMLRHADVELNTGSTLSIESAIFDRPVVLAAFDSPKTRGYYHSVRHGLDVTHYRFVQATGGVARANGPEELVARVKEYLDDPTRDAAGRKRLVQELVGEPGNAGARIGQFVLSQVNH